MQNKKNIDIYTFLCQFADWIEAHPSSVKNFSVSTLKPKGTVKNSLAIYLRQLADWIESLPSGLESSVAYLRQLADWIKTHPSSFENFTALPTKPKKAATSHTDIPDVAKIYADSGVKGLNQFLESCDIKTLKRIISKNSFDPSRVSQKWKDKNRFVSYIVKCAGDRSQKGEKF